MSEATAEAPESGAVPEWRSLFDLLSITPVDGIVTYAAMSDLLGREFLDNRAPIYKARDELLYSAKRAIVCIPRKGFRVVRANEHAILAQSRRKRARKEMDRSLALVVNTDVADLTPRERQRRIALELNLKAQAQMLRLTNIRVDRLEVKIDETTNAQDQRLAILERTLRDHGIEVPNGQPETIQGEVIDPEE
jgi:hypothetical protein